MSYVTYSQEEVETMSNEDLIKHILGESSIVSNNSNELPQPKG